MDFAQIINTPSLGQIVIIDDVGTASHHHPGYIDLYMASDEGICKLQIDRVDIMLTSALEEATQHPEALQRLIQILHRKGGSSFADYIAKANRPPFAKLFHSTRFGQIVAIRDGEMNDKRFHIAIRFRPTRPVHIAMSSVITAADELREKHPDMDAQELMAHQFANMQLEHAERCIESYLNYAEKVPAIPPITFS